MRSSVPSRNIILACGHPEGLATLHRPGYEDDLEPLTAWCPVCEADVNVTKILGDGQEARNG